MTMKSFYSPQRNDIYAIVRLCLLANSRSNGFYNNWGLYRASGEYA